MSQLTHLEELKCSRRKRAFTLIEVLMVVLVIAILGSIVITRVVGASRKSRETNLRGNLSRLRYAIQYFENHTGAYPPQLRDIIARNAGAISADQDGQGRTIDKSEYKGPYISPNDGAGLPADPFTGQADWTYDNATGDVHSASPKLALDGTSYNSW